MRRSWTSRSRIMIEQDKKKDRENKEEHRSSKMRGKEEEQQDKEMKKFINFFALKETILPILLTGV